VSVPIHKLAALDHQYIWHPFTQMKDWLAREPIVITRGKGATLWDANGRKYLDANSSIWTNLHGHRHPAMDRAIERQLKRIAHSSALGLANEPASLLGKRLVDAANIPGLKPGMSKVFYSDDGSTAMEVALKLSYEHSRRAGISRPRFLSLEGAYHGDTIGAVSLGHIGLFHQTYRGLLFDTDKVMAPYCYRCPFNRARPERADARNYRMCGWECVREVERAFSNANKEGRRITAFVVEPLIQGAAGMIPQPQGWLQRVAPIARAYNAQIIMDEVLTAFGRATDPQKGQSWFASHQENVAPDFIAVAKGLTGGYLPLSATLTTQAVFDSFLGEYEQFRTFFHGHSYTANQLGTAAALANLDLLDQEKSYRSRHALTKAMQQELAALWSLSAVGDIRQVGLIAGIELVRNWRTREPFDLRERAGFRVCEAMAQRGVLTRPIGNVIVMMPPYCTTDRQLRRMFKALADAVTEVL
jgi:adenosylmethionine---8-amino-7-oxononanoate aminotransferase